MGEEILTFTLGNFQEPNGSPLPPKHELRKSVKFKIFFLSPPQLKSIFLLLNFHNALYEVA